MKKVLAVDLFKKELGTNAICGAYACVRHRQYQLNIPANYVLDSAEVNGLTVGSVLFNVPLTPDLIELVRERFETATSNCECTVDRSLSLCAYSDGLRRLALAKELRGSKGEADLLLTSAAALDVAQVNRQEIDRLVTARDRWRDRLLRVEQAAQAMDALFLDLEKCVVVPTEDKVVIKLQDVLHVLRPLRDALR